MDGTRSSVRCRLVSPTLVVSIFNGSDLATWLLVQLRLSWLLLLPCSAWLLGCTRLVARSTRCMGWIVVARNRKQKSFTRFVCRSVHQCRIARCISPEPRIEDENRGSSEDIDIEERGRHGQLPSTAAAADPYHSFRSTLSACRMVFKLSSARQNSYHSFRLQPSGSAMFVISSMSTMWASMIAIWRCSDGEQTTLVDDGHAMGRTSGDASRNAAEDDTCRQVHSRR